MKQAAISLAFLIGLGSLLGGYSAWAQTAEGEVGIPTPVNRLQQNCSVVQATLRRLHDNDALLRVNAGQIYNNISNRLMARFNSRLALNKINSAELVKITDSFEKQRTNFSSRYNDYEQALSSLLKINCKTKPTEFYAQLINTRDARTKLAVAVRQLNESLAAYGTEVENVKKSLSSEEVDE